MIRVEEIEVFNFRGAMRGMRNPKESWHKADTVGEVVGPADFALAKSLVLAGTDHSKFMRQIFFSADITAPMSWWWDTDTYKVATVKNSTSRMHMLGTRELTPDDFSFDSEAGIVHLSPLRQLTLEDINDRIRTFQRTGDMKLWREICMDLPQSYNFKATWTGSYQVLRAIYHSRRKHKQREFREFCSILEGLPSSELITTTRASQDKRKF